MAPIRTRSLIPELELLRLLTFISGLIGTTTVPNRKKREWVRPWLKRRAMKSVHSNLLQEFCLEDQASFKQFHRMNRTEFSELLEKVTPLIAKKDTCRPQFRLLSGHVQAS